MKPPPLGLPSLVMATYGIMAACLPYCQPSEMSFSASVGRSGQVGGQLPEERRAQMQNRHRLPRGPTPLPGQVVPRYE
jgi:hypothetical protein